jgi:hypothetical protein
MPREKQNLAKYACETLAGGQLLLARNSLPSLYQQSLFQVSRELLISMVHYSRTLPPNTSSPMIKQPAVWIKLFCCVEAMTDDVIDERKLAAELCAKLGTGRDNCLAT